jgi:diguanylate cyclase (GGDEF)-like protein
MQKQRIGSVIIVRDKFPLGIVTQGDIVNSIAQKSCEWLSNMRAADIMKKPVRSLTPKEDLKKALQFMLDNKIRRLPIVENKKLMGIISYGDIMREVQKELAEATIKTAQLKTEIERDGLTHFLTQKYFKKNLNQEVDRVKRYGGILSLLMIDIDHFKKINDTYGHDAGDYILQKVSFLISKNTRKVNTIGRYGGDEFAIIAPISDAESSRRLGERLRQFVAQTNFKYNEKKIVAEGSKFNQKKIIKVTVSIGVASWDKSIIDGRGLIIKADKALYLSKHGGRNLVSVL